MESGTSSKQPLLHNTLKRSRASPTSSQGGSDEECDQPAKKISTSSQKGKAKAPAPAFQRECWNYGLKC